MVWLVSRISVEVLIQVVCCVIWLLFDEKGIGRFVRAGHTAIETLDRPATCESTEHPEQVEFHSG
jgi:hypothetical protein